MDEKMYTIEQLKKVKGIGEATIQRIVEQYAEPLEYDTSYRDYQPHELDYWDDDIWLMYGDCLDRMRDIPDESVDMVLTDMPYGTTACKWDSIIPLKPMWAHLKRVTKPNGVIVMTASQPFTSALVMSNIDSYAHSWIWDKVTARGHLVAKLRPMVQHEDILVFSYTGRHPSYYPQMIDRPIDKVEYRKTTEYKRTDIMGGRSIAPQNVVYDKWYPKTIIVESNAGSSVKSIHPTQKPVALMEYLIKTYTLEGDMVLDFTMGSGTTGVACRNLNRKFIGIELDETYYKLAKDRILNGDK
jgi:site-specific DNA-methyltransferase (adenine-specific)